MNLVLLFDEDFVAPGLVRLTGRRCEHLRNVLQSPPGGTVVVGHFGGGIGSAEVVRIDRDAAELRVVIDRDPPPPLPATLVLALPRPKVLNRVIAAATSMGVKRIVLVNAWRVEKSYWSTPKLSQTNLFAQVVAGLEQACDTIAPQIEMRRLFRPFVEEELKSIAAGTRCFVAHPRASERAPGSFGEAVTLAIGPEGGFIDAEIASLERIGFEPVSLGPRILRVETAVPVLLGRLTYNDGQRR